MANKKAIAAPRTPPANLDSVIVRMTWSSSRVIHRVHPAVYEAERFNPGPNGNARFSPITDACGGSIPTIYGGTTFHCAAMETVFHDLPFTPGLKSMRKEKLRGHSYSQIIPAQDLTLADLSGPALRKIGIKRVDLIDTEKRRYRFTRKWAEAIHAQCADVQGLCWVSRQDERALALIIFGDRVGADSLGIHAPSVDLVAHVATYADLVGLADDNGLKLYGP